MLRSSNRVLYLEDFKKKISKISQWPICLDLCDVGQLRSDATVVIIKLPRNGDIL